MSYFEKLNHSEEIERAATGLPSSVLRREEIEALRAAEDRSGVLNYVIRVRSEEDPTVSVFSFFGDERAVASRLLRAAKRLT